MGTGLGSACARVTVGAPYVCGLVCGSVWYALRSLDFMLQRVAWWLGQDCPADLGTGKSLRTSCSLEPGTLGGGPVVSAQDTTGALRHKPGRVTGGAGGRLSRMCSYTTSQHTSHPWAFAHASPSASASFPLPLSPFLFLCLSPTELEGGKRLLAIIFGILVTKLYCWIKPYLQLPSLTFSS